MSTTTKVSSNGSNGTIDASNIRSKESVRIETVTPAKAKSWLEGNVDNRKLRENRVVHLAGLLRRGEWELTGDAIVFDDQGVLINGQHRLTAVVVAEIPARFIILRGLPSKAQEVMDQGLTRSLGDQLHRRGVSYTNSVASALVWSAQFEYNEATGNVHYADNQSMRPTYRQLLARFESSPGLEDTAKATSRVQHYLKLRHGPLIAVKYRLDQIDAEESDLFFDTLREGTGLQKNDPIWRLREWLIEDARTRSTRGRTPAYRVNAMMFKAWNMWRDGLTTHKLSWVFSPTKKEAWPTPH